MKSILPKLDYVIIQCRGISYIDLEELVKKFDDYSIKVKILFQVGHDCDKVKYHYYQEKEEDLVDLKKELDCFEGVIVLRTIYDFYMKDALDVVGIIKDTLESSSDDVIDIDIFEMKDGKKCSWIELGY